MTTLSLADDLDAGGLDPRRHAIRVDLADQALKGRVSAERFAPTPLVGQIEAVALRKLRHPHLGKKLRGYLD